MDTTKKERRTHVGIMLANFKREGSVPDAEHIALLERYIEGTITFGDLFDHAREYVTTVQEREQVKCDIEDISVQFVRLSKGYDESCTAYDEDRRQAALASIGMGADQRKRQEAVDFARSSLFLSGLKVSETCEQEVARFVRGEISIEEFLVIGPIN